MQSKTISCFIEKENAKRLNPMKHESLVGTSLWNKKNIEIVLNIKQ